MTTKEDVMWNIQDTISGLKMARLQDIEQISALQTHIRAIDAKIKTLNLRIKEVR